MQKLKVFIALGAMVAAFGIVSSAYADEIISAPELVAETVVEPTPYESMLAELIILQAQESDPETGAFSRFFLRLKIKQLENQLNLKKTLDQGTL